MAKIFLLLTFCAVYVLVYGITPSSFLTKTDQLRLKMMFESAKPYSKDMKSIYHSVYGLYYVSGSRLELPKSICDALGHADKESVESIFYATQVSEILKKSNYQCGLDWKVETVLNNAINDKATTRTLYQAVASLVYFKKSVDSKKVQTLLTAALKQDDSVLSHGYAFYAASYTSGDLKKWFDLIEDIMMQADEVDDTYMQFEGGLQTTAVVVDAAYQLATATGKAPVVTEDKVVKFANYFVSRKHVQTLKMGFYVARAIHTLTTNNYHIPVVVTLNSQVALSDKFKTVQVRVSNLYGNSIGDVKLTADTARHTGDDAVVLSKKQFKQTSFDKTLFDLDFMEAKPARGFYKIILSVSPTKADARFIGLVGAQVEVKVTTKVAVENVEVGIADKDQVVPPKPLRLQHPNKAGTVLQGDHAQKLVMMFNLRDAQANQPMTSHQVFVQLTNKKTKQEIIYVAEADQTQKYKFELDIGDKAKEFGHKSGDYSMNLLVGDSVLSNPISWNVADVTFTFPDTGASAEKKPSRFAKQPEITHMFREPDKRPPGVVSKFFTVMVLAPLLLLVLIWMKMGANLSNMPLSLSTVGFHVSLGAIFVLYYVYWMSLDMFTTLRYLAIIGLPAFLFGHKLLSGIAARRK